MMVRLHHGRAVVALLSAALSAGCNSSAPLPNAATRSGSVNTSVAPRTGAQYKLLHNFGGGEDGQYPSGNLTVFKGRLYGTTCKGGARGYGTVFSMSSTGVERVLYSFNNTNGACPLAGFVVLNDTLYSSTADGGRGSPFRCGSNRCGTIFSVSSAGLVRVVYNFKNARSGDHPSTNLTVLNGALYGTTYYGGGGCGGTGCGTAFSVTPNGTYQVIHNFGRGFGHQHAPYNPNGSLTLFNSTFYGMTLSGGASDMGAVYVLSPAGKEHVLYSFARGSNGSSPYGDVTVLNGSLYGTTFDGGAGTGCPGIGGCGTVFRLTTDGQQSVLYSFNYSEGDGSFPEAGVIVLKGILYGVTSSGGGGCGGSYGCGTVFSVTTDGQETVLHSFVGSDGSDPVANLIAWHGTLYGTTSAGGKYDKGTVFALTP